MTPRRPCDRVSRGPGEGAVRSGPQRLRRALAARLQAEEDRAEQHLDDIRARLTAIFVGDHRGRGRGCDRRRLRSSAAGSPDPSTTSPTRSGTCTRGALDSPIRITGPPELASLALDVDAMRGRIREQLVESERSRQAVEQSAAVVLTLRSELEPTVGDLPDGWTVAGRLRAAEGVVAGDCYDLFTTRDGQIALVVVDIAGHGATEGILALRCKEMLRTALTSGAAPGDALDTTAEILGDMGEEVFLTAFVAVIDTARRPRPLRQRRAPAGVRGR